MIVRLKHTDGHEMAFECVAFNYSPTSLAVSFVSPTGKELDWDAGTMAVIEEMTIHYDSGILLKKVKGPALFEGAQGTASEAIDSEHQRHEDIVAGHGHKTGRSTAGMGG